MTRSVRGSDAIVAHVPWHLTRTDGRHPAIRHEKSTARPAAGACEKREGATGVAVNHSAAAPRTPAAPSTDRDCRRYVPRKAASRSRTLHSKPAFCEPQPKEKPRRRQRGQFVEKSTCPINTRSGRVFRTSSTNRHHPWGQRGQRIGHFVPHCKAG